jgi:hypothetical protein
VRTTIAPPTRRGFCIANKQLEAVVHHHDDPDYYGYPPWHWLPDELDVDRGDPGDEVEDGFVPQPMSNAWGGELGRAGALIVDRLDGRTGNEG